MTEAQHFSLDGQHGIVTGGARGIGFAIAQRLIEAGASVTIADQDSDAVQQSVQDLGSAARGCVSWM